MTLPRGRSHELLKMASFATLFLCLLYLGISIQRYISNSGLSSAFPLLGDQRVRPFSDLRWVAVVASCGTKYQELYKANLANCVSYGYGAGGGYPDAGYPPMSSWLLSLSGFSENSLNLIALGGIIILVVILLFSCRFAFAYSWAWAATMAALLMSFPLQHLLEKANIDIFVYTLLAAVAYTAQLDKPIFLIASFVFTFMPISLKIFPAPGVCAWALIPSVLRGNRAWIMRKRSIYAVMAGVFAGLALSIPWFPIGSMNAMGDMRSYGLLAIGYINNTIIDLVGLDAARWVLRSFIVSKALFLSVGTYSCFVAKADRAVESFFLSKSETPRKAKFLHSYFTLFSWTWLFSYAVTISYNHRLVFLFPAIILLACLLSGNDKLTTWQLRVLSTALVCSAIALYFPIIHELFLKNMLRLSTFIDLGIELFIFPLLAGIVLVLLIGPYARGIYRAES